MAARAKRKFLSFFERMARNFFSKKISDTLFELGQQLGKIGEKRIDFEHLVSGPSEPKTSRP